MHLATRHNELAAKLEEAGESLSDYELREVTNIEQERILNLTASTKEDVRTGHDDHQRTDNPKSACRFVEEWSFRRITFPRGWVRVQLREVKGRSW